MKFIKLTYYRSSREYGANRLGATQKNFYVNLDNVERFTPYLDSTKLSFTSGQEIEVVEKMKRIMELANES